MASRGQAAPGDTPRRTALPLLVALALGLLSAGVARLASTSPVLRPMEARTADYRFLLRSSAPPPSSSIVLVCLDDESRRRHEGEPEIFWWRRYARVLRGALEGGATAVGFDFLLKASLGDEGGGRQARRTELAASERLMQRQMRAYLDEVVGDMAGLLNDHPGRVVLPVALFERHTRLETPVEALTLVAGEQNLGLANLSQDDDGFFRSLPLGMVHDRGTEKGVYYPAMGALLACKGAGEPPPEPSLGFLWKGKAVPLVDGRLMINFAGPAGTFPMIPFWEVDEQVARGDKDALRARFAGRLVLVGDTESLSQDRVPTPFNASGSPVKMTGLECHANVANTLLAERFLRRLPEGWEFLVLLTLCLAAAWATFRLSPWQGGFVSLVLLASGGGAGWLLFEVWGWLLHLVPILVGVPLTFAVVSAWRHQVVYSEKQFLRRLLERYVAEQTVSEERILGLLVDLGGQFVGAREGSLLVLDREADELVCVLTHGEAGERAECQVGRRTPRGKGLTGLAALTHEVQVNNPVLPEADGDGQAHASESRRGEDGPADDPSLEGARAELAAPMLIEDELVGVITAWGFPPGRCITMADAQLYARMASIAGVVVDLRRRLNLLEACQRGSPMPAPLTESERIERQVMESLSGLMRDHPEKLEDVARLLASVTALGK